MYRETHSSIGRDHSFIGLWFRGIDRWSLLATAVLLIIGVLVSFSISPDIGARLGLGSYILAYKHSVFAGAAWVLLLVCSMMTPHETARISLFILIGAVLGLIMLPFLGQSYNGSTRWLDLGPISVQPSEIVKPAFAITAARLIASQCRGDPIPGIAMTLVLYLVIITFLLLQPDIGQSLILTLILLAQWFVAGMPLLLISVALVVVCFGLIVFYLTFSHFADRIHDFLHPSESGFRQIDFARMAFENGGFLGQGSGGGTIKQKIFDLQSDFIFAAIGEDFGIVACLLVLFCYGLIVFRGLWRCMIQKDLFVSLAVLGLLVQFAGHVLINVGSVSGLIPPKGTTLPFLSSGGTAVLGMAYAMASVLALTRHSYFPAESAFDPETPHRQKKLYHEMGL